MSKRESGAQRRERLEAIQKEQKAAQRKRTLLTAGVGLGAGVLIIGGTSFAIWQNEQNKPTNQPLSAFGVPLAGAACSDVETFAESGTNNHTTDPVEYETNPPAFGPHHPQWMDPQRKFYSTADAPPVERLVHNLEHGYNILWYSPDLPQAEIDDIEVIAEKFGDDPRTHKFIATPRDESRGEFPEGVTVSMSHWGVPEASLQHCEAFSGEAVGEFVDAHPITNAPEPNAP